MATVKAAAHRNALVALTRFLAQDRVGGVMGPAIEMIIKVIRASGGIAYTADAGRLDLVAESSLPRRAKGWLARLSTEGEAWFVAQRVAQTQKVIVDADVAASRGGMGIRPALEEAGWNVLCAAPIRLGRRLHGVVVLAAQHPSVFDQETQMFLETVGTLLALASEREEALNRMRERRLETDRTAQLATLGLVAGAVARDLSTPLGSLSMQLEAQSETVARLRDVVQGRSAGEAAGLLDTVEVLLMDANEALRRAQSVNSRLLALGRETQPEPVDLSMVLRDCGALMATELEIRGVGLELFDAGEALWVDGRVESLQMMFVQLLVWAAEQCHEAEVSNPRIEIRLTSQGDRHVVTIGASSRGEQLPSTRVFDRLVGRTGHGSLGLELARQTIRMHDGHIELGKSDDDVSIGVVLPASFPAEIEPTRASLPSRTSPTEAIPNIVWIDDDAAFVRAMCRNITRYQAFVAGTVAEGRELLFALTSLPELILCDVNLPDGLGIALHAEAPAALQQRFVFVTGALLSDEIARYLKASGCPTLIKPIRTEEIYALLGDSDEFARVSRTLGPQSSRLSDEPQRASNAPILEDQAFADPTFADGAFADQAHPDHALLDPLPAPPQPGAWSEAAADALDEEEEHRDSFNDLFDQTFGEPDEGDRQTDPEAPGDKQARQLRRSQE